MSCRHFSSLALFILMSLIAVACGRESSGRTPSDELAVAFAHPPDSARPWVYWMWMDGNLTREGITADLEAMRAAGLGRRRHLRGQCRHPAGPGQVHEPRVAPRCSSTSSGKPSGSACR